ncbi:MAG: hypothetical protein ACI4QI_02795 [Candidatus Coproplasma sp.]
MKSKKISLFAFIVGVIASVIAFSLFAACTTASPNDTAYWFSQNSYEFVKYEDDKDNLDKAGAYWYFTAAKNEDITLSVRINVDNYYSAAYLYVNDAQVKSENNTGIYTYVYNLSLKKGDKLKLHAFWVNSLVYQENGFEISMLTIGDGQKSYPLKEFDKSTTT